MFNRVILIGNIAKDAELRYTPGGTPVTTLRLASNTKFKQSETVKEEVLFIDVVVWGKQAESCTQYLHKGNSCLVEGRLQERRWESDGQHKSKIEIVAQTVRFLNTRPKSNGGDSGSHEEVTVPEEFSNSEPF